MTVHECHSTAEAIAHADAYLNNVVLPNYSDLLDLLQKMIDNPRDHIEEDAEIRGILYGAER